MLMLLLIANIVFLPPMRCNTKEEAEKNKFNRFFAKCEPINSNFNLNVRRRRRKNKWIGNKNDTQKTISLYTLLVRIFSLTVDSNTQAWVAYWYNDLIFFCSKPNVVRTDWNVHHEGMMAKSSCQNFKKRTGEMKEKE